jgi:hypothetical protein
MAVTILVSKRMLQHHLQSYNSSLHKYNAELFVFLILHYKQHHHSSLAGYYLV